MRIFYIVLANIAFPFLIFYLFCYVRKFYHIVILKEKEKQIPKLNSKLIIILLTSGIILLTSVLVISRLTIEPEVRGETYKVKEYNFR